MSQITTQPRNKHHRAMIGLNRSNGITGDDMDKYLNKITQGDCLELMKDLPDNSIDLVLTDPPYGMNFQSNYRIEKHDRIIGDNELPIKAINECLRVAKKAAYIFFDGII